MLNALNYLKIYWDVCKTLAIKENNYKQLIIRWLGWGKELLVEIISSNLKFNPEFFWNNRNVFQNIHHHNMKLQSQNTIYFLRVLQEAHTINMKKSQLAGSQSHALLGKSLNN